MKKEDIEHLATLARIKITDKEAAALASDITSILGYVSDIESITGDSGETKQVGAVNNVFRVDGEPHEPGIYTKDILAEAPNKKGDYLEVKKILGNK